MTTYSVSFIDAGRNFGARSWRDPSDPTVLYHLREKNQVSVSDPTGFEGVTMNAVTGVNTQLEFWASASSYGDLGACFTNAADINFNNSNLTGTATKLYIAGSSRTSGPNTDEAVIIEFNKSDFDVSKHYATGYYLTADGTTRAKKSNGVAVMHPSGTYYARGGSTDLDETFIASPAFTTSYIELYRPSNDAYGFVALATANSISGFTGLHSVNTTPICFSSDGKLWFLTMPWASGGGTRPDMTSGQSTLYKATINEAAGVLSLTIDASYTVPDNYHAYAAGSGATLSFAETFAYKRTVYDSSANKIYFWSGWYNSSGDTNYDEAWFLEFDITSGTFTAGGASSPVTWDAGTILNNSLGPHLDSAGYSLDNILTTHGTSNNPAVQTFNFYDIDAGSSLTELLLQATFGFAEELTNSTLYHTTDGSNRYIYAVDVTSTFNDDGFEIFQDALFTILDAGAETQAEIRAGKHGGPFPSAWFMPPIGEWTQYAVIVHAEGLETRPSKAFSRLKYAHDYVEQIMDEGFTYRDEFFPPSDILHIWIADEDGNMNLYKDQGAR